MGLWCSSYSAGGSEDEYSATGTNIPIPGQAKCNETP